jgi:hypothetical protein
MSVSEYVTRFTQLSCYAPNNMDTDEKKQDWFLIALNDGLAYALEARNFKKIEDMVDKALALENQQGIMEHKRKMQRSRALGNNKSFVIVHHLKDLSFVLVSSKGCKLQLKDSTLHSVKSSVPIFSLLVLHRHHHRETMLDQTLLHEDPISIVGRMGILPTSVYRGSRTRM